MSIDRTSRPPLRLWPGVIAGVLLFLRGVVPAVAPTPETVGGGMLVGMLGALLVVVWWVFFSRAPWLDRVVVIAVAGVAMAATFQVIHPSIAGGLMGRMFLVYASQSVAFALVAWAVATRHWAQPARRVSLVAAMLIACAVWTLVRTDGIRGGGSQWAWRWSPTHEELLLARAGEAPTDAPVPSNAPTNAAESAVAPTASPLAAPPAAAGTTKGEAVAAEPTVSAIEWPGFRGRDRNSVVPDARIATDWTVSPPVELWRRPIGPGWSSFAVHGDFLYTQEQRGDEEIVACYRVSTGAPVWRHADAARFWESNGGAGPRGTPTLHGDRVYTFGATGIVNALDARDGRVAWSRNAAADTGVKLPGWGFTSSPLVVDGLVVVAVAGQLAAYDLESGAPRWVGPAHGGSYSSPQQLTIHGVAQVVLLSTAGATGVAPADGTVLWEHDWPGGAIVQPALTDDGDLLINSISMMGGLGIRRVALTREAAGWRAEERWTSNGLKPYFNDFVVHNGHAYGFDGSILACIDLADGKRKWKGGRYGDGQLVLLPSQNLLLVLSEDGELALVSATADRFTEIARVPAIDGKTWNHPVLVGNILLVRNGQEMAAFRLATSAR